jgi:hypothetical protein
MAKYHEPAAASKWNAMISDSGETPSPTPKEAPQSAGANPPCPNCQARGSCEYRRGIASVRGACWHCRINFQYLNINPAATGQAYVDYTRPPPTISAELDKAEKE